jgi:hypothetical protein
MPASRLIGRHPAYPIPLVTIGSFMAGPTGKLSG